MSSYNKSIEGVAPYYNDYSEGKKFLKVLFKPGYAVQARELTQVQSIIQNQIERFGNHVFRDGSVVSGAKTGYTQSKFIRVNLTDPVSGLALDTTKLQGYEIYSVANPDIRAKVLHVDVSAGGTDDYHVVVFEYVTGFGEFAANDVLRSTYQDAAINAKVKSISVGEVGSTQASIPATGIAYTVTVESGIFYVDGYFVLTDKQTIALSRPATVLDTTVPLGIRIYEEPTAMVGFQVSRSVVDVTTDTSLNDPAFGLSNSSAAGADRYQILLTLTSIPFDVAAGIEVDLPKNFIERLRYVNGAITRFEKYAFYSDLEDTLARRTNDQSGSFTVRPFTLDIREHFRGDEIVKLTVASTSGFTIGSTVTQTIGTGINAVRSTGIVRGVDTTNNVLRVFTSNNRFVVGLAVVQSGVVASSIVSKIESLYLAYDGIYPEHKGGDKSKLMLGLEPGKAYVFGYEFENPSTEYLPIDKARTTEFTPSLNVDADLGNYAVVARVNTAGAKYGAYTSTSTNGWTIASIVRDALFTVNQGSVVDVYKGGSVTVSSSVVTASGGTKIGTARIRGVKNSQTDRARLYLTEINIDTGETFADATYFTTGGDTEAAFVVSTATSAGEIGRTGGVTNLFGTDRNLALFPLPTGDLPRTVTALDYSVEKYVTATCAISAGTATIVCPSTGYANVRYRTGDNKHRIITRSGLTYDVQNTDITTNNTGAGALSPGTMTITRTSAATYLQGVSNGDTVLLALTVDVNALASNTIRKKTLSGVVSETSIAFDNSSSTYTDPIYGSVRTVTLANVDCYTLYEVIDTSSGNDVTDKFSLDSGQRDSLYNFGRLIEKPGSSLTGPFDVKYQYFQRSGTGPFIVNSYDGIDYAQIPVYNSPTTGKNFPLAMYIDFRPDITTTSVTNTVVNNGQVSTTANPSRHYKFLTSFDYPAIGESFNVTYEYYLSRIDKIVLTKDRKFSVIQGVPARIPSEPPDSSEAMSLYILNIAPYTFGADGVSRTFIENKRYTMRDIGSLEKRIDRIEYYTALNLLEQNTQALSVQDSTGADVFKNGFIVDNFKGHGIGDVYNPGYYCSMDFKKGELRPAFRLRHQGIIPVEDTVQSALKYVVSSDGIATLSYTPTEYIVQPLASQAINVNPYNVVNWMGSMNMLPDSDTWVDTTVAPDIRINEDGNYDALVAQLPQTSYGTQWGGWDSWWIGDTAYSDGTTQTRTQAERQGNWQGDRYGTYGIAYRGINQSQIDSFLTPTNGRVIGVTPLTYTRTGVTTAITPQTITRELGSKIIDVSLVPYMRTKRIVTTSLGLKPKTRLYAFFDGTEVTDNCKTLLPGSRIDSWTTLSADYAEVKFTLPWACGSYLTAGDGVITGTFVEILTGGVPDYSIKSLGMLLGSEFKTDEIGTTYGNPNLVRGRVTDVTGNVVTVKIATSVTVDPTALDTEYNDEYIVTRNPITDFVSTNNVITLKGVLFSDPSGQNVTQYIVPAGKFKTGERLFRLTDNSSNSVTAATTTSEKVYRASGTTETRQNTIVSSRVPTITRQSVTETFTQYNVTTNYNLPAQNPLAEQQQPCYSDPLAQTFLVAAQQHPNGLYVDSIDAFFKTKDENIPVRLQIRPTANGYPHSSMVVPLADVTLLPADVKVSDLPDVNNPETITNFKFSSPIYLAPGEYAITLLSNSNNYNAWIAEIGANRIGTSQRITEQPYAGSLFKSQNSSTWTAEQTQDLMFRINRCKFNVGSTESLIYRNDLISFAGRTTSQTSPDPITNGSETDLILYDAAEVLATYVEIPGSYITFEMADRPYGSSGASQNLNYRLIQPNETIYFNEVQTSLAYGVKGSSTTDPSPKIRVSMSTTDDAISPSFDTTRFGGSYIQTFISDWTTASLTDELNARSTVVRNDTTQSAWARYMTKKVTLSPGFESDGITVLFNAYKPQGSTIQVYAKIQETTDSRSFDDIPYVLVPNVSQATSTSLNDIREHKHQYFLASGKTYNAVSIKICMFTSNPANSPYVKALRAICTI